MFVCLDNLHALGRYVEKLDLNDFHYFARTFLMWFKNSCQINMLSRYLKFCFYSWLSVKKNIFLNVWLFLTSLEKNSIYSLRVWIYFPRRIYFCLWLLARLSVIIVLDHLSPIWYWLQSLWEVISVFWSSHKSLGVYQVPLLCPSLNFNFCLLTLYICKTTLFSFLAFSSSLLESTITLCGKVLQKPYLARFTFLELFLSWIMDLQIFSSLDTLQLI